MALARSLSEKIEDAQRAWSRVTVARPVVEREPMILPWPSLASLELPDLDSLELPDLELPAEMLLETLADCELPEDEAMGVIPILPRDELAAILLRLEEAGLSLEV